MSDKNQHIESEEVNNAENIQHEIPSDEDIPTDEKKEEISADEKMAEMQDKYLRLSAEFDNYRKRTLKERYELIKTAGEDIIQGLLPIMDDFDRAIAAMVQTDASAPVKEGITLIFDKMQNFLKQKGLIEIEAIGKEFDTDHFEAIAKVPVNEQNKKGKVIDVAQKGYMLNDKVIRYAKVVVGE